MKKYFFDTSLIIAGCIKSHPHHASAHPWLKSSQQNKIEAYISNHTLAEIYSVLTKIPLQPALSATFVEEYIRQEILDDMSVIDLSTKDYRAALKRVKDQNLKGGIIYDALHLQACLKKKITQLITFNSKDFERLVAGDDIKILNPAL